MPRAVSWLTTQHNRYHPPCCRGTDVAERTLPWNLSWTCAIAVEVGTRPLLGIGETISDRLRAGTQGSLLRKSSIVTRMRELRTIPAVWQLHCVRLLRLLARLSLVFASHQANHPPVERHSLINPCEG